MAKIMFFAHDPGGANAISPLIAPLAVEHDIFVFAKGPAQSKISGAAPLQENTLASVKPDLLITGTCSNDRTEKYLWQEAKGLNIKSMAIVDHWMNYGIRFSKYGLSEIERYNNDRTFDYLPDYVIVMDEFAKSEMVKEGVPEEKIFALGNPHFEAVLESAKDIDSQKTRRDLGIKEEEYLITFASEPYIEDYGSGPELDALKDLLEIVAELKQNTKVIIRPHPKEKPEKFSRFNSVRVDKTTPYCESILASDLIVSMTSMFLIEASILGKRILSYQLGASSPDFFILTRNHVLPFINNKEELRRQLSASFLSDKGYHRFNVGNNAIKRNLKFISEVLCHKQF